MQAAQDAVIRATRGSNLRRSAIAVLTAVTIASPALADSPVRLDQSVFVERSASGKVRVIEPARRLTRGDRVVLVLDWQAPPAPRGFTVTSAVPATLSFERSSAGAQDVSVDGGRSWGQLIFQGLFKTER